MSGIDVRWEQRLDNYGKALAQLQSAVALSQTRALSELEQQGLIQAFEFTHELAWNVMKDYFFDQGASQITGSRDATRQAFSTGLVERVTQRYAMPFEGFEAFEAFGVKMESPRGA